MIQTIFNKGSLPLLEQSLYFTSRRHDAIANNIANIETPRYKAIDAPVADFKEAMRRSLESRDEKRIPVFVMEEYRNVAPRPGGGLSMEFIEAPEHGILNHLENNVDVDLEMGKLVKNAQRHNFAATLMSHQFGMLRTAISMKV